MFDVTDPADLLALKTEVNTDPSGMGYIPTSTDIGVLSLINDPENNVGGESINKEVEDLQIPELAEVIDETEYAELDVYDTAWCKMFIERQPDEGILQFQGKLFSIFDVASTTRANFLALLPKLATRGEVLFGVNTIISSSDWTTARDS
jgi:hypothetical protein